MAKRCNHSKYADGHCAEMSCPNYTNKCPRHSTSGSPNAECTLDPLENYEVFFRDPQTGDNWSCFYMAEDFAHAEEQALDGAGTNPDPIVKIVRDYD